MFTFSTRSLRVKFPLITTFILLLVFTLASVVRIMQNTAFQKQSLLARSETSAELATKQLGDAYTLYHNSGVLKLNDIFRQTLDLNDTISRIEIISVTGEVLLDTNTIGRGDTDTASQVTVVDETLLQAIASNNVTKIKDSNGDVKEIIVPYSDNFGSRPFSLRYFISYDSITDSITQAILTTVYLNILMFLITLAAITILVNRSILSPLATITTAARAIEHGDLEQNIEVATRDELQDLAQSLNQMTTTLKNDIFKLKKTDQLKDEFITIASHNLRTPLTVIKGYVATLKEKNLDEEALTYIKTIDESVEKLNKITESLLNIVSLERTNQPLTRHPEDIAQIIRTIVTEYNPLALEKHVTFSLHIPEQEVMIVIDRDKVQQAIANIINNAVKFNKKNGVVTVDLSALNDEIILSVSDTGIGITAEEIDNIFQRFHRGTDVLTYNYEGIGLGLYLSKIIIEAHGGKIRITSKIGEGTNVYISLPRGYDIVQVRS